MSYPGAGDTTDRQTDRQTVSEAQRERERERDRQTDRETERETERERERETEKDRERDVHLAHCRTDAVCFRSIYFAAKSEFFMDTHRKSSMNKLNNSPLFTILTVMYMATSPRQLQIFR